MKKQPEITEKTRRNLLDAYWMLYRQKPASEITVQKVADKAGYHRSTFYAYFNSITDIHRQMENMLLDIIQNNASHVLLPAIMNDGLPNLAELYPYFAGEYLRILLKENGDSSFAGRLKQVLYGVIVQSFGVQSADKKKEYILEYTVSGILAVLTRWYAKGDISEEEVFELIESLMSKKTPVAYLIP